MLAAGDGTRLSTLTTDANGRLVPKQFCSLNGGGSLLQEAIQRAGGIVPRERVCVIVADQHRQYWESMLRTLPFGNVIVQPRNCGTANGILLPALTILERDPLARIVFLPATHYVYDERTLAGSLRQAAVLLTRNPHGLAMLGIEPEKADPGLGYIVPGRKLADGTRSIDQFAEKPESRLARQLFLNGALWNSFILAAGAPALLNLFRARVPNVVALMETVVAYDTRLGRRAVALRELYECLPSIDFLREVAQGAECELRVITSPSCGWNDLGTPERVAVTLQRIGQERLHRIASPSPIPSVVAAPAAINLAAQHARLDRAA